MSMELWQEIDAERIYRTVLELEGTRHFYAHQPALDRAADRISAAMQECGLCVREQPFTIGSHPAKFRNIEGSLGPVDREPAAVVMAHYDTVDTTPGANDDAGGIAVLLEVARVLSTLPEPPPVYFVAVSQEEDSNPGIFTPERESAIRHGVRDERSTFTSWAVASHYRALQARARQGFFAGATMADALRKVLAEPELAPADAVVGARPPHLEAHIKEIIPLYEEMTVTSAIGRHNRIGSSRWVAEAVGLKRRIAFCINLDEIGVYRDTEHSQGELDPSVPIFQSMTEQHLTDPDRRPGNFVLVLSERASEGVARSLLATCRHTVRDLPYGWLSIPYDFEGICRHLPRALSADHASFWQAGIPAVFLFDTSTARDHYVHTPADTADKLDYDKLRLIGGTITAALAERAIYQADVQGGGS